MSFWKALGISLIINAIIIVLYGYFVMPVISDAAIGIAKFMCESQGQKCEFKK